MSVQYHLKLAPGDVAPYVLLPGDPGRVGAAQMERLARVGSETVRILAERDAAGGSDASPGPRASRAARAPSAPGSPR